MPLAKPKPGGTGKKSAKGTAPDGAGNTVAVAGPSIADAYDAIFPSSDSDETAAALLAKPKPGGIGNTSAKGRAPDGSGNTVPPAKNARTIAAMAPPPPIV